MTLYSLFLGLLCSLCSCGPSLPAEIEAVADQLPEQLDFNIHVKPILSDRCFACHGPDKAKQKAGLQLDLPEKAFAELPENPGKYAIRPGDLNGSEVFHRLISTDPELMMPPPESDLALSDYEKAVLIRWIKQGAEYKSHWAFIKPEQPELPDVAHEKQVNNEIDRFILRKVEQKGWRPAPAADKALLLRRLSFDLTGLPPTPQEIENFLADHAPDAYEKQVDRLLASPHYGERMATDWMDLARFADTHGYTVDRYRDMSPWRDWVIKAFNENMPYDQFITWQLAGDLLPNPTHEQLLATGFNRNHQQNMEGGIVDEEFRVEYVADRTNTLGKAFLGLTMECARCHDHKYDPISQKEYYQLFSFFNNVKEAGQISWDNAMPVPTLLLTDPQVDEITHFIGQQLESEKAALAEIAQTEKPAFEAWLQTGRKQLLQSGEWPKGLVAHFPLENAGLVNRLNPREKGTMKQQHVTTPLVPNLQKGYEGQGLLLDGDAWLDLGSTGVFERHQPFSAGIHVNIPASLKNGVIFHKGDGAALYNFRGYHLALKDGRLEILMAHTTPANAVVEYAAAVPRDQWVQLLLTHDGSGTADGFRLYINGEEAETTVETDNLYKSILFGRGKNEPGLQVGARWRGQGAKGATVDDIVVFNRELTPLEVLQLVIPDRFTSLCNTPADQLSAAERQLFQTYFQHQLSPQFRQHQISIEDLRARYNAALDTVQEVMVIQEMKKRRPAFILERGQYDTYGDEVFPDTPERIFPMPDSLPKNRLGLAQWLFLPEHPLTSRVAVNRIWQQFFGRSLVRTAEDFGNQGELPSHPELLDWLAIRFRDTGWDTKAMIKYIVMSATYRQSSKALENITKADPENILLARGPSARLTAEMLRDNALAAGDLLVSRIGGKSVKPYQLEGLWRINGASYEESKGEDLHRRSLYTIWKRTVPHPTQATFDAPTRDNCTVRRQKTSTPLQALTLLNDPVYVEAARAIGQLISTSEQTDAGIEIAFRRLTGRQPVSGELELLLELQRTEYQKFSEHPEKIKGWLNAGTLAPPEGQDVALLAANTVVASTILNADATIIKR
ncbi:MAG: DUF1553 domain-containing protein [Saprospiraceae bacterium]